MKIRAFLDKHSVLVLLLPYLVLFCLFIVIPSIASVALSFTDFNTIELPHFVGLKNYISLLTNDTIFTRNVLPNTLIMRCLWGWAAMCCPSLWRGRCPS